MRMVIPAATPASMRLRLLSMVWSSPMDSTSPLRPGFVPGLAARQA